MSTRRRLAAAAAALALGLALPLPGAGAVPTMVSLNESPGCGAPDGTRGPLASANYTGRYLPDAEPVRGPWGSLYGRTIGEVRASLVEVELPMPAPGLPPARVWVHRLVEPALRRAIENLRAEETRGNYYPILSNQVSSFRPMTIPPNRYMSFHAMGAAVDINYRTNPYSAANVFVTDMPAWFVKAWTDAGWCWGGNWQEIKDTMHFSWQGPLLSPGYVPQPPVPPVTSPASFTRSVSFSPALSSAPAGTFSFLADMDRDGALDAAQVRPAALVGGRFVVAAQARHGYETCWASGPTSIAAVPGASLLLADGTGQGRPDLWEVDPSSGALVITIHPLGSGFEASRPAQATGIPWTEGAVLLVGDHQRDTKADLYVVRIGETPTLEVWPGPDFAGKLLEVALPAGIGAGWRFALGDRDVDGIPDLFALSPDNPAWLIVVPGAAGFSGPAEAVGTGVPGLGGVFQVGDLDGDGRGDLYFYDGNTTVTAFLGGEWDGASTAAMPMVWPGTSFDFVLAVQQMLVLLGYDPGPADGRYGAMTRAAVIAFQAAHGLVADGVVGTQTRAALAQEVAAVTGSVPGAGPSPASLTYWFFEGHDRHWARGAGCPVDPGASFGNFKVAGMPGATASLYYSPALGSWVAAGMPAIDPAWARSLSGTGLDLEAVPTAYGNRFAVLRVGPRVYVDVLSSRGALVRTVNFGTAPRVADLVPVARRGTWTLGVLVDRGASASMWIRSATSGWLLANVPLGALRPAAAIAIDPDGDGTSDIVVMGTLADGRSVVRVVSLWGRVLATRIFPAGTVARSLAAVSTPSGPVVAVLLGDTAAGTARVAVFTPGQLVEAASHAVPAGTQVTAAGTDIVLAYRDQATAAVWYEGRNALSGGQLYLVQLSLGFEPAAITPALGGGVVLGAQRADDGTIRVDRRDAAGARTSWSHFHLRPVSPERRGIG